MNTTLEQATGQHIDEWVLRHVELDAIIAQATEEKQAINGQLIETLGDGTHETRHARVMISRRGTVDKAKLAADYPAEQFPALYEHTLSTEAMKKQFAPAALEQYKVYSAPSVTIK